MNRDQSAGLEFTWRVGFPSAPSQQTGLGAEEKLDVALREDTLLVNETEWSATVAGRGSYRKCRLVRAGGQ